MRNWLYRALPCFLMVIFFAASSFALTDTVTLYSFEDGPEGWAIPEWALEKEDNASAEVNVSEYYATDGKYSLELKVDFPRASTWHGAYVECPIGVTDWSPFEWLSFDVYLPEGAPRTLRVRPIATIGEEWKWSEANKAIRLVPGEWTVVRVNLSAESLDWRRFLDDQFRSDVRKLGVRIEANSSDGYQGSVYVDNIKLSKE